MLRDWRDTYDQWKLASPYDEYSGAAGDDDEPEDLGPADTLDDLDERCGP